MIKWIFFVVILTSAMFAHSVSLKKTVECVDAETLFQGLIGSDYKEKPIWIGIESDAAMSKYSLFVNDDIFSGESLYTNSV